MEFDANMVTKDGKRMQYLIALSVKKECPDYDVIWKELYRRMNAVSIPIIPVDWPLYDDDGNVQDYEDCLFYAQTFETGMGFVMGILKNHNIRINLEFCYFFNGDFYKNDTKKYGKEDPLNTVKKLIEKHHPEEIW